MEKIKVAVAGVGFIGPAHIEALRRTPNIEVVAISHPVEDEVKQKAADLGIPNGYADFNEMLEKEDVKAVHICTPNFLHYEMAKAALEKGLHVICEKPLAWSCC